ncbi:MAG: peptidoglycan DD-metalloendopeptidase family protein [Pseudomonadota bacterium]
MVWVVVGAVVWPGGPLTPARADDAVATLERAVTALSEAEAALAAATEGSERLAALGLAIRAQEAALAAYRRVMRLVAGRADIIDTRIETGGAQVSRLLASLQSLSSAPQSALFAYPGGPLRAARAQMLLAAVTPALEQQRIALAAELSGLQTLRAEQNAAGDGARTALSGLQDLRAETAIALDERRRSLPPRRLMRQQAEAARATADDLGALSENIATTLTEVPGAAQGTAGALALPFSAVQGRLPLPVEGSVTGRFGDPDPFGNAGAGMTITAPAYATVTAPLRATVRFAGQLTGFGTIVILEPEAGWLITLAGLARADREIGEVLATGETIGVMDETLPEPNEILLAHMDERGLIGNRKLYVELRRDGVPIDPVPWFAGLE